MDEPLYKAESFKVIGICMEVHTQLGGGFNEIVDKDALEIRINSWSSCLFNRVEK
jgi:hypothetical protein